MRLLRVVGNDYESLHTIRRYHWDDDIPLPSVEAMIESLRELQRKGWVQTYRLDADTTEFVPVVDFEDEEALRPVELTSQSSLWWLITESGLTAIEHEDA
ncbi:MAG TPA: hypothetical protein VL332_05305 [Candidatus Saccharimonadaceae bacterium]|jgi:hypothetical protein|nr:hypothetical protein [Candidatus Saccharimonadaceae bacterium]